MKIDENEKYEELCATFQYQWIVLLKNSLKKHGIPTATAKEICGDFSFDLSMLFDQGDFELEGSLFRPVLAFTDDEDEPTLIVQEGSVEFHEYAFGTTDEVFESEQDEEPFNAQAQRPPRS